LTRKGDDDLPASRLRSKAGVGHHRGYRTRRSLTKGELEGHLPRLLIAISLGKAMKIKTARSEKRAEKNI
jgi:hypothetical protein